MHPSSYTSIIRALFLFSALATFSSCHAATPTQPFAQVTALHYRDPIEKPYSIPPPTASPTFSPSPSITPSPTAPIIGASPGPVLFGPIEVHFQPIEVQSPKGELHVTATGIPEKITLASEVKSVPFDLHWPRDPIHFNAVPIEMKWPQEPLKITVDIEGSGSEKHANAVRSCDCKHPPEDARPRTVAANEWQKRIDELNKKIDSDLAAAMKQLEEQRQANKISQEAFEEEKKKLEQELEAKKRETPETLRKREIASERRWIFGVILLAGLLGGLATHALEYLRITRPFKKDLKTVREGARQNAKALAAAQSAIATAQSEKNWEILKEVEEKIAANKEEQKELWERIRSERRTWWTRYDELGPVLFLAVVAAFMVPGALLFHSSNKTSGCLR